MNLLNTYLDISKYFTSWIILLVISHRYTSKVFNLILLTLLTCVGGLYISFVYPKFYQFQFSSLQITVSTFTERSITEFFIHFLLLLFVLNIYNDNYMFFSSQSLNSIIFIIVYLLMIDVRKVYHLRYSDIAKISLFFMITLIMLFLYKKI